MGLIKKLLGGLFAFVGGLFGGLAKVAGLGKKSEYFLEAEPAPASAAKSADAKPAGVTVNAASKVDAPARTQEALVQAVAADLKVDLQNDSNGKKDATLNAAAADKPVVAPSKVPTVKASVEDGVKTFAPEFLISSNTRSSRRRPGPSLNPFLDMAKQMKPQG
ncbi:hypothetical protein ACQ4M4_23775 [Leptolyngbya sp. AN02str]|uniref:hypothetical protein n=1 Tax=Leptolyngbya sp. AN02str TaxID=3423363 RepID=UPI003D31E259